MLLRSAWAIGRRWPASIAGRGHVRVIDLRGEEGPPVGFIAAVLPAIAVAVPVRPRGFARYTYFVNPLVSATGIASTCFFAVPDGTATNVYAHITGTQGPVRAVAGTLFVR